MISHKSCRLCVYASGSLIISIFKSLASIKLSFLHFGQNNGKLFSIVSFLNLVRVLFPQTGQWIHSIFTVSFSFYHSTPLTLIRLWIIQKASTWSAPYNLPHGFPVFSNYQKAGNTPYHSQIFPYPTFRFHFSARLTSPRQTEVYTLRVCIW